MLCLLYWVAFWVVAAGAAVVDGAVVEEVPAVLAVSAAEVLVAVAQVAVGKLISFHLFL